MSYQFLSISKNILHWAYKVCLVGLVSLAVLVAISAFPIFSLHTFTVLSGSMEPEISTGSLIFVKEQKSYTIGDIVTRLSKNQNTTITHRIIEEETNENGDVFFRTKGDANDAADMEKFPQTEIIGKIIFSVPLLGRLVAFAKTPHGFLLLVVVPGAIIISDELRFLRTEIMKKFQKTADKNA